MAKTVQEFCANCKKNFDMPVVQEGGPKSDMVWVECPECHEIKPLETPQGQDMPAKDQAGHKAADESGGPAGRSYPGDTEFEVGDSVYHKAWDDTGEVLEKKYSSGGHLMIIVEFTKQGKKKLIV